MNNDRLIVLENVSNQTVGVRDTQNRTYRLGVGGKIRISEVSLQDILDLPGSRTIFDEGLIKINNIDPMKLYNMGLTEKEIAKYCAEEVPTPTIVVTPKVEEVVEEEVIIIPEEDEEEVLETIEEVIEEEVKPVEEEVIEVVETPAVEYTAPKKPANKKSTTKKSSKRK